jgi:hypothetical protein
MHLLQLIAFWTNSSQRRNGNLTMSFDLHNFDLQKDQFSINPRYRLQWEEAQQCHVLLSPDVLNKMA